MLDLRTPPSRPQVAPPPPKLRPPRRWIILWLSGALAAAAISVGLFFAIQAFRPKPATTQATPQNNDVARTQIIEKVGKIYLLPTGEDPAVARIQDRSKLDGQDFYKDSRNGDYVLVYQKTKLAIIYREPDNKIIIAAPVAAQGPTTSP